MEHTKQTKIPCPHCGQPITVQIVAEVETVKADSRTQVHIDDIAPIRCSSCKEYVQAQISNLYVGYEVVPLETN